MNTLRRYFKLYALMLFSVVFFSVSASSVCAQDAAVGDVAREQADMVDSRAQELSLQEVIDKAFNSNLDIKLARLDKLIAETSLGLAYSVYDAYLALEYGYTDQETDTASALMASKEKSGTYSAGITKKFATGTQVGLGLSGERSKSNSTFVDINPNFTNTAELSVTQPLLKNFGGMIDRGTVDMVRIDISQFSEYTLSKIEAHLADVEVFYWDMVGAQDTLRAKKRALTKAKELLDINRDKLKTGLAEDTDVFASEANLHLRQTEVLVAENKYEDRVKDLLLALNEPIDEPIAAKEDIVVDETAPDKQGVLKEAFARRRDYKQMLEELQAQDISVSMKKNSLWPQLDLIGSFSLNGLDSGSAGSFERIKDGDYSTYFVGASLSYSLNNRAAESDYEKAKFEKARSLVQLQQLEKSILKEVDEKFRQLQLTMYTFVETKKIEEFQRKKLTSEEKKLGQGRSNSFTLIDFQEDLIQAESATISSMVEYKKALVELELAQNMILDKWGYENN